MLSRVSRSFARVGSSQYLKQSRTIVHHIKSKVAEHRDNIPPVALFIGISALCFQIAVLYPWHEELSVQFIEVQNLTANLIESTRKLDKKVDMLLKLEEEIKVKERKILDREEDIYNRELAIEAKLDALLGATQRK